MRIFPATLEMIPGGGQIRDDFSCCTLGPSTKGSNANDPLSDDMSVGTDTSTYSRGQTVVLSAGGLDTQARQIVEWLDTVLYDPDR